MKNKIVDMGAWGPVYARKIHVYHAGPISSAPGQKWGYAWSTNAYRTCSEAIAAAKKKHPEIEFKANFARD